MKGIIKKLNVVLILAIMFSFSQMSFSKSTFSSEKIRKSIENYIYQNVGEDAEISLPKYINIQEFNDDGVIANITTQLENLQGNSTIKMEYRKNGTLLRYIEIPVRIKLYRDVVVAKETIISGEILGDRNLTIEKKEVTNFKEDQFFSINSLKGQKAKRNITKGNILTKSQVLAGNYIKRGDKVTLIVKSGQVKIRTYGVALQDAEEGNTIRVKRDGQQGIFQGKINNDGTVLISLN